MILNKNSEFSKKGIKETCDFFHVDIINGLNDSDVIKNRELYGENKLDETKKKSFWKVFFTQMKNPMIYILFLAIAITLSVSIYETVKAGRFDFLNIGDWADVVIIIAVILLNSLIGTIQERKAENSLSALKKLSSPQVNVIRGGNPLRIKSNELVVGDLVILSEGDVVSADMRLVESFNLKINESSLTGESVPVEKNAQLTFSNDLPLAERLNMVHSSTIVTYGHAKAIVTNVGMNTEIGQVAQSLTNNQNELTPLQKKLNKLSKFLGILTAIIVVFVFAIDAIWLCVDGKTSSIGSWIESLLSSVALAVAAIPEGLVAVVTIILALGVTRMVKANAIIRKLPSVETLGSVNVICSDKTGTLTQNKMTVVEAYVDLKNYQNFNSDNLKFLATGFALCSDATLTFGDPTEIALINFAKTLNLDKKDLEKQYPRLNEISFDSNRKMMSVQNHQYIFTKGALDSILSRVTRIIINGKIRKISEDDINGIKNINLNYSSRALRVLALAYKEKDVLKEENLIFVGLVAMIDPPRVEVKDAVHKLKNAGIKTIMITGDHSSTALAIAKNLDIAEKEEECLSGLEIDKLSFDTLKEKVKNIRVFARVSPQNKVDIVKALKANGDIVAMTGDGVNDAPSLKAADIGVAMGKVGTDVAKEASDMILTDDNFASIEKAVEEGRSIFANIKKTILFLLSSNISEVLTMVILIIIGLPAPFVAIHLLWVNLITDSLPAIALGVDPKEKNIMNEKPHSQKESFFANGGLNSVFIYGGIITIAVIIAYFIPAWSMNAFSLKSIKDVYNSFPQIRVTAQTMAFVTLAISELFHMLGMSNINQSFINVFKKKNKLILLAFLLGIGLQVFVVLVPGVNQVFKTSTLSWQQWLSVILLSLMPLIVHEVIVLIKYLIHRHK